MLIQGEHGRRIKIKNLDPNDILIVENCINTTIKPLKDILVFDGIVIKESNNVVLENIINYGKTEIKKDNLNIKLKGCYLCGGILLYGNKCEFTVNTINGNMELIYASDNTFISNKIICNEIDFFESHNNKYYLNILDLNSIYLNRSNENVFYKNLLLNIGKSKIPVLEKDSKGNVFDKDVFKKESENLLDETLFEKKIVEVPNILEMDTETLRSFVKALKK